MWGRVVVVGSVLGLVGCAHQQPPPEEKPVPVAQPAPPPKQLEAEPVAAPSVDAAAELDQALRSATVFFDFDRDQLQPEGMTALQKAANVLRKHKDLKIKIEGHCDERGTEEYNLALGQRRAEAASKYLKALGVGVDQVDTVSYGSLQPAVDGHDEGAWARNRRGELKRAAN